ncbi:DUF58 domain-containing protein [Natrinema sp. 74]|uniref:DUF58 domain-containing protein n=1 Tax=Natrinema sp. 74 TaxID=3384159 RepID=UPI0038D4E378
MRLTRHLWGCLSLAGFLAAFAVVLGRPLPLAGTALIGAWVLATQSSFLAALDRTTRRLSVTRTVPSPTVRVDESTPVTVSAAFADPVFLSLDVEVGLPVATATTDPVTPVLELEPETTTVTETVVTTWPTAGEHRFGPARVTATDGRFVETFAAGERPTVSVEPRGPGRVHVGEGGDRRATLYGSHTLRRSGRGIEPSELREQVPGDAAKRIDWKATARLETPHVREYETETTRRTLLVVDHRQSLAVGPSAETKLDYLREVMLATAEIARELDDPVGLVGVDDRGVTERIEPTATAETYATVRRTLREVEPTSTRATATGRATGHSERLSGVAAPPSVHDQPTRSTARRSILHLEDESNPFAETLRPFYADSKRYQRLLRDRPLADAVRTAATDTASAMWTVVFTDDSDPAELRETVSLASANAAVTVFLAPTVLYEPGGIDDLEQAYERYLAFEELRRDLNRLERVRAFEVTPGDRLASVLEAGRERGDRR